MGVIGGIGAPRGWRDFGLTRMCALVGLALSVAAVAPTPAPADEDWTTADRRNSIFVFGGPLSTTDIWSSMIFNVHKPSGRVLYDNFVVGGAYGRDILDLTEHLRFGVEAGAALRFGDYKSCCNPVVRGSVRSGEFWGAGVLRHTGFDLFGGSVRIAPAVAVGISTVTKPIGAEHGVQSHFESGNSRTLFYLGPELSLTSPSWGNVEFVYRLHHRSGLYGTLGNVKEGYNANAFGLRFRY